MSKKQIMLVVACVAIGVAGGIYIERKLSNPDPNPGWQTRPGKLRSIPRVTATNVHAELKLLLKEEEDPSEKTAARPFYARCSEFAGQLAPDAFPAATEAALALNETRRQQMLTQLIKRWVRADLESAKKFALDRTGPERKSVMTELFNSWVIESSKSLENWLLEDPDPEAIQIGLPILVRGLSQRDPARAFYLWKKIPSEDQFHAGVMLFAHWERTDPAAVVTNLAAMPELHQFRQGDLNSSLRKWLKIDAPAAVTFIKQLPEGKRRRDLIATAAPELTRVDPAIAVQLIQSLAYSEYRQTVLRAVVSAWAAEDAQAAFAWAREQTDGVERRLALEASLDNLGAVDPAALQNFILKEPSHPAVVENAASLARHFAGTNASGLLDWARRLPPGRTRDTILGRGLAGLEALPPNEAVTFAIENLAGTARLSALRQIFERWAARDPQAAGASATQMTIGDARSTAMEVVASKWAESEPEDAMNCILSIKESPDRLRAETATVRAVQQRQPSEAAAFLMNLKPSEHSAKLMESAIEQWADVNLNAAAEWLSTQPDDIRRRHGFGKLVDAVLTTDIVRAADYALKSPEHRDYRDARQRVANQWARQEPEAATRWLTANATNNVGLSRQFKQVFGAWSHAAPEQAISFLLALPVDSPCFTSKNARFESFHIAVSHWAEREPATALKWVESHATGSQLGFLVQAILNQWSNRSPDGLVQALRDMPVGTRRDGLAAQSLRILATSQPELAAHNVALVGDPKERHSVMESVFTLWQRRDAESARTWLRTNSLPENLKTRLQRPSE